MNIKPIFTGLFLFLALSQAPLSAAAESTQNYYIRFLNKHPHHENVTILLDGQPYGDVTYGTAGKFVKVPLGKHEVIIGEMKQTLDISPFRPLPHDMYFTAQVSPEYKSTDPKKIVISPSGGSNGLYRPFENVIAPPKFTTPVPGAVITTELDAINKDQSGKTYITYYNFSDTGYEIKTDDVSSSAYGVASPGESGAKYVPSTKEPIAVYINGHKLEVVNAPALEAGQSYTIIVVGEGDARKATITKDNYSLLNP